MSNPLPSDPLYEAQTPRQNMSGNKHINKKRQAIKVCLVIAAVLLAAVLALIGFIVFSPDTALPGTNPTAADENNAAGIQKVGSDADLIAAGGHHTVGIQKDGTVAATVPKKRRDYGQCDVRDWRNIVSVSAGGSHTVGLKSDGTVVSTGFNDYGQCDVKDWRDITMISAGTAHTVGLKSDGTVVAVGNNEYGQCEVSQWTNITAVAGGELFTVGLREDGTVVATAHDYDRYHGECDVTKWTKITAISASGSQTVGLREDGTVVATGENHYGQCEVEDLRDIVAISVGLRHTVFLKSDGTVVARGYNGYGQCTGVERWTNIVAIAAGFKNTVGLRSDGTVVSTKFAAGTLEDDRQCQVSDWKDMKLPDGMKEAAPLPRIEEPSAVPDWKIVELGAYEQDGDTSNGKEAIEWIVLDQKDGKALVVSRYALDCRRYHESYEDVTWETCTLRTWLNGAFIQEAFSADESARILTSEVTADGNRDWSTDAGNDTIDKVFLLSASQAETYFSSNEARMCGATMYAVAQGVDTGYIDEEIGLEKDEAADCWWWLRTPGRYTYDAVFVGYNGSVETDGAMVDDRDLAVRPAMWVEMDTE